MPCCPEIKTDLNVIIKLLSNLKPGKAAGPDSVKAVVLKQLKMEIVPVICLLFEKKSSNRTTPFRMKNVQVCPLFKNFLNMYCM